jgi:hypothetical protein
MVGPSLALFVLAGAVLAAVPAGADHPQADRGRSVSFDHRTGNEWWVEVILGGADGSSVTSVEAQDTNGPWTALAKKSWGAWTASFRIEPGHDVRFRATWSDGDQLGSCWFTHPAGAERCPTTTSTTSTTTTSTTTSTTQTTSTTSTTGTAPPPGPITFDHRGGNEWWVEAAVSGATPTRVQAQDDGGPWTELAFKSWGAWAGSFRIEPGHDVRFRAEVSGAWAESCWFTHPGGKTPTGGATCSAGSAPPPTQPFATFSGVKGNPYWVEARVAADRPLAGVDARVDDGAWRPLALRDWGAWAASFHVPDGSYVDFRATATDGATAVSGDYVWPSARPVGDWPVAGSFVSYLIRTSGGAPDGSWSQSTEARLRLAYDGASWAGRCVGSTTETDYTGTSTTSTFDLAVTGAPARATTTPQAGVAFDPALLESSALAQCQQAQDAIVPEQEASHGTSLRDASGRQVALWTWIGGEPEDRSPYSSDVLVWETRFGLALDWSHSGRGGGFDGHLVDTDAPIR